MQTIAYVNKHGKTRYKFKMYESEFTDLDSNSTGLCIACCADRDSCEPDARGYECYECEENKVYGAAELLLCGSIIIIEE